MGGGEICHETVRASVGVALSDREECSYLTATSGSHAVVLFGNSVIESDDLTRFIIVDICEAVQFKITGGFVEAATIAERLAQRIKAECAAVVPLVDEYLGRMLIGGGKCFELRFFRGCDFPIAVYRLSGTEYSAGGERREVSGVIFGNEITPPKCQSLLMN